MPRSADVVVIGGGLAGTTAALAARERGASVRLLSAKQSTLRQASGLIDVLGYTPAGEGPLTDPLDAVEDLPEGHPYERAGRDAVERGLALFDDVAGDLYRGGHTDRNALVPTHVGTVKPTARYPASVAPGLASRAEDTLLVGFETVTGFDAPLAADHLAAAGAPFDVRGVTVPFPGDLRADAKRTRYARLLDANELVDVGGFSAPARQALGDRIASHLGDAERVGLPAILGEDHPEAVRASLSAALDVPVFEVPMDPPSLPGVRLETRLYRAMGDRGVRLTTGNPVVDFDADGGRVTSVTLDRAGTTVRHEAREFVLATGGLVGKGIDSDRSGVREPIFDCHVPHPDDRYDWFADAAFGDHPFARFGVTVDRELRPLDAAGDPEFDNLRAAGAVLGGCDYAAEKAASGVSLATGHAAGDAAATRALEAIA